MDALEAFGDDGADAQQARTFRGPVPGGTRTVFLSGKNDERRSALGVPDRGVVNAHRLAFGQQPRDAAFRSWRELVAQSHVGKGAADHDFVVAAARSIGVEVGGFHSVLGKVFPRGAVELDGAGRRDVVRSDGVAEHREDPSAGDFLDRRGLRRHSIEIRRFADVSRIRLPLVYVPGGEAELPPIRVAVGDSRVFLRVTLRGNGGGYDARDFLLGGPDVPEEDRLARGIFAKGVLVEVVVDAACKGVSDDQRRRHKVVGAYL